ncbi:hypothetical protein Q3G72_015317 [Acer saccharum]|nr:hypothetical protein Q3G72_015317 [Acer saccharum]
MGKAITNLTRATHAIVEEKFTILLKDHDKVDNIIKCSNELTIDISADSFCEVSAVVENGTELRVVCRVKMVNPNDMMGKKKLRAIRHFLLIGIAKIIHSSRATLGKNRERSFSFSSLIMSDEIVNLEEGTTGQLPTRLSNVTTQRFQDIHKEDVGGEVVPLGDQVSAIRRLPPLRRRQLLLLHRCQGH